MESRERRRDRGGDELLDPYDDPMGDVPGGERPVAADTRPIDPPDGGTWEDDARRLELHEEQLVAHQDLRHLGDVVVRTEVEEIPGRLEVDAYREEVEVDHVPVGRVVRERVAPWEDGEVLVVPVYEEQLVAVKRLVLKEELRIRRVASTERQVFQDVLRRERLVIEDLQNTGLVHEQFPTGAPAGELPVEGRARGERSAGERATRDERRDDGGFLENLVRKALQ
jgi:uncharacterized protein (TIGR02271 family)